MPTRLITQPSPCRHVRCRPTHPRSRLLEETICQICRGTSRCQPRCQLLRACPIHCKGLFRVCPTCNRNLQRRPCRPVFTNNWAKQCLGLQPVHTPNRAANTSQVTVAGGDDLPDLPGNQQMPAALPAPTGLSHPLPGALPGLSHLQQKPAEAAMPACTYQLLGRAMFRPATSSYPQHVQLSLASQRCQSVRYFPPGAATRRHAGLCLSSTPLQT